MIIASTNHPERIDDSIINRPSRFDVKYTFDYPTEALRKTFALRWLRKINALPPERKSFIDFARTESELAEEIAKTTEGWSFAFLKELYVSPYHIFLESLTCLLQRFAVLHPSCSTLLTIRLSATTAQARTNP